MYHCLVHFYLMGQPHGLSSLIKEISPLPSFSHNFFESEHLHTDFLARADLTLADLRGQNAAQTVREILQHKKTQGEVIALVTTEQREELGALLPGLADVWILPMSEAEVRFRFSRWQREFKLRKDFWLTSQYLESTINSSPDLIWYKDKNGIHQKVNDAFCRVVNKPKKDVEGRGHAYIWNVEFDDPACIKSEQTVMQTRKTCVSEETIQTSQGPRILTTYKSPLYDVDGSVMGTAGLAVDITQERSYAQEVIQKNQELETLFATLDCGVMLHTVDGSQIISINRAALEILGYPSLEAMQADGFNLIAASVMEEDKPKLREKIKSLKAPGDAADIEYRVQHKNGQILYVMGNIKLIEEQGQLLFQRYLLDCTAQKFQQDRELKEAQTRQMALIYALCIEYNLVCHFNLETGKGKTLRISSSEKTDLKPIFSGQLSLESTLERYIAAWVHVEDRELFRQFVSRENLEKMLGEKAICSLNYRIVRQGQTLYCQLKASRTGDWDKTHNVVIGLRNIDEETRSARERNTLLEEALAQANRASKAKSTFLSNMSHDLRTPMNAIIGFTNLALTRIGRRDLVEEYLNKIMASGNHMLGLINDVLDMSHIESGKIRLEEDLCLLSEIIHNLQTIIQGDVRAKNLHLDIQVDVRHENILCDRLRLNQLLLNLLSNAVKYTDEGGISVRVIEKESSQAGFANYEFRVKDTGIGMSEEFVSRIFEPFERERNSTLSGVQGTGLGMAITKNIVDLMNGTITVHSKRSAGTECIVCLPLKLNSGEHDSAAPKNGPADTQEGNASSGDNAVSRAWHILLVEDNLLNQEIAVSILEEEGFTVEVADNGQIAVEMIKNSRPGHFQAVLMDIQMPVMNGYEATKRIRRLENKALASIPIIATTANAFEEDKKEALQSGMNGHIAKPIEVHTLLKTLAECVNK